MKPAEYYRGREQTYLKHFFLERYLERVAYKVGSFANEFVYVDGFSGPWRTEDPGFADSSFVIAIDKLRHVRDGLAKIGRTPRIRCVFAEPDSAAYPLLKQATSTVTDLDVVTLNAEFGDALPRIQSAVGQAFSLVFIDPTGWTGFGLRQIAPILQHNPGEVIINFMFDHINRFLDAPEPEMSFDDLFGGPGWKAAVAAGAKREDAIVRLYTERMKATGGFKFATSTRIKKPLADRSYFYLVYGTRHPEGLLEFRKVEQREIAEQERVRLDAQQLARVTRTGQSELFGSVDSDDIGLPSFEEERRDNLNLAEHLLMELLKQRKEIAFEDARSAMLEFPLVWETDVQRAVLERATVLGMKPRERVPKVGHRVRLKGGS
ncbi:MAG TPA: three-Cys-motif partner protein TcmP [Vicinamibacterales bacterium]|nr:three-Cys-motif partner protein TcmP [Vicinamibacterales bacterium]